MFGESWLDRMVREGVVVDDSCDAFDLCSVYRRRRSEETVRIGGGLLQHFLQPKENNKSEENTKPKRNRVPGTF